MENLRHVIEKKIYDNRNANALVRPMPSFELTGNVLTKDCPSPMKQYWSIELDAMEMAILRFLYHPRKRAEISRQFHETYSDEEIDRVLHEHLELASVLWLRCKTCHPSRGGGNDRECVTSTLRSVATVRPHERS